VHHDERRVWDEADSKTDIGSFTSLLHDLMLS
jgi:hypothetical protein